MNSYEQILIRMGVDAKAVVTGLNKVSSFAKGWATGFAHDMKTTMGRMFTGLFAVQGIEAGAHKAMEWLEETNRKILTIKNDARNLGVSTNFVQGIMLEASKSGYAFEQIEKPLGHLNELLGQAKDGSLQAREKLVQFGLATKDTKWDTLNLKDSLANLAAQHVKSADAATRNFREHELFGKGFETLIPILNQGANAIKQLDNSNFFSKYNQSTINLFTGLFGAKATAGQVISATAGNLFESLMPILSMMSNKDVNAGFLTFALEKTVEAHGAVINKIQSENDAQQASIEYQMKQVELANRLAEMTQKRAELEASIADRNKSTIQEMADRTRKLLGIPTPEALNFTVSARDLESLRIDTAERQAKVAFERGNDQLSQGLTGYALQARTAFTGGKYEDVHPMQRTEMELHNLVDLTQPISKMAAMVNSQNNTQR